MDINAYIESGILELYVAGALSEKENQEVYSLLLEYPELLQEVLEIESAILKLTASVSPAERKNLYPIIIDKIRNGDTDFIKDSDTKVISIDKPRYNWFTYTGWAAAFILGAGLFWTLNTNEQLETKIANQEIEMSDLENQVADAKNNLEANRQLLATIRDKNIIEVPLAGQANFENTYAKVYWNKETDEILLDAQGLPEPPRGKVYQVWSLTLSPLTPTSLGTLDSFITDDNKLFSIENALESEAFGITLEPEGGSEGPTMEQLYTLGAVSSGAGQ